MHDLRISRDEVEARQHRLLEVTDEYDGVVIFGFVNLQYFSNFYNVPTQRPVALGLTPESTHLVVPKQDVIHVERNDDFVYDELHSYYEYPQSSPMETVAEMCAALGIDEGAIAADADGPPRKLGYYGPRLSDVVDATVTPIDEQLQEARRVKSDAELELYREGGRWARLAHQQLQDRMAVGAYPLEVAQRVEADAARTMLDALGDRYQLTSWGPPIEVVFTAGEGTAFSHNIDQTKRIAPGDVIETFVMVDVDSYKTGKLERTMVVGEPTEEQRYYFELMREAGDRIAAAIEPGVEYGVAEEVADEYFSEHGVTDLQHHRPGHGMGLTWLSYPLLDRGLEGTFTEGEVFTIEPGLYVPSVGGFRHCDTVTVTADGLEFLTEYPRDLESLTVPVK